MRELQAARGAPLTGAGQPGLGTAGTGGASATGGARGRRRVTVALIIALVVLCCDVVSKAVVVVTLPECLSDKPPVRVAGSLLTLCVSRNAGAAFSIGAQGFTLLFTVIAATVIVFVLRMSRRIRSLPWAVTLGLLLGGATGNLVDRLFRAPGPLRGEVVDWIQLPHWPVFNLADSSIVCGGVLAVLLALRGTRIDGAGAPAPAPAAASADGAGGPRPGDLVTDAAPGGDQAAGHDAPVADGEPG